MIGKEYNTSSQIDLNINKNTGVNFMKQKTLGKIPLKTKNLNEINKIKERCKKEILNIPGE